MDKHNIFMSLQCVNYLLSIDFAAMQSIFVCLNQCLADTENPFHVYRIQVFSVSLLLVLLLLFLVFCCSDVFLFVLHVGSRILAVI